VPCGRLPAGAPKCDLLESFNAAFKHHLDIQPKQPRTRLEASDAFVKLAKFVHGWSAQVAEDTGVFRYWEVDPTTTDSRIQREIGTLWDSTNEYRTEVCLVEHHLIQATNGVKHWRLWKSGRCEMGGGARGGGEEAGLPTHCV
jgi:hypothetical protein